MTRSPVAWVGAKSLQLDVLLPLIPYGQRYIEPFGGGGSVLLARRTSPVEVYNDLSGDLVNLFRVIQGPGCEDLVLLLEHTFYSRENFAEAIDILKSKEPDPLLRAWAFFVRQNQGIGGIASDRVTESYWSRSKKDTISLKNFKSRIPRLAEIHERMSNVQIENRDALVCIKEWDSDETVYYLDPPYVFDTRKSEEFYDIEMKDEDHHRLVEILLDVEGAVILSGYMTDLYQPLLDAGWQALSYSETTSIGIATGASVSSRTEVVWRNPRALRYGQGSLF
jgi:DNA adenine methylase